MDILQHIERLRKQDTLDLLQGCERARNRWLRAFILWAIALFAHIGMHVAFGFSWQTWVTFGAVVFGAGVDFVLWRRYRRVLRRLHVVLEETLGLGLDPECVSPLRAQLAYLPEETQLRAALLLADVKP